MRGQSGREGQVTLQSLRDWVPAVILASLTLGSAYIAVEFATWLGFSLQANLLYTASVAILLASLALGQWPSAGGELARTISRLIERRGLLLVLIVSAIARFGFLMESSIFPDEYWVLLALQGKPLKSVPIFLIDYQRYVGPFATHPPLSFLLLDIGYELLPSLAGARLVSLVFSTATVAVVYYFVRDVGKPQLALVTAAIYGLLPHTALFPTLALTDGISNFFGLASTWLFLRCIKRGLPRLSLASGILLGLSLWTRSWQPFLWLFLGSIVLLLFSSKKYMRRDFASFGVMSASGVGIYLLWSLLNPGAFFISVEVLRRIIILAQNIPNPFSLGNGSQEGGIPVLSYLFPKLKLATLSSVSYVQLIAQLPIWVTPAVAVLGIAGLIVAVRRERKLALLNLVWVLVPLALVLYLLRDVRYLVLAVPAYVFLAASGSNLGSEKARRAMKSVLIGSILIFLLIALPIAHQLYGGIDGASEQLTKLGLADGKVLTNAPALSYYLPKLQVFLLSPSDSPDAVVNLLKEKGIEAVVVVHNARGVWPEIDPSVIEAIEARFQGHLSGGPSSFSWYELFYAPVS